MPAAAALVRESDTITIRPNDPAAAARRSASIEERALLTYQAMSDSDDIVLVLERNGGMETGDAIVIAANDAFHRV